MKRILSMAFVAVMSVVAVSCASKKQVYAPAFEEEEEVVVITERTPQRTATTTVQAQQQARPIRSQEEKVTLTHGASMKRYHVIVGSFANEQNAINLRNKLNGQGYTSVIMRNDSGMSRVSIAGYDEEIPARNELMQVRDRFDEYKDAWLLITRQ